MRWSCLLLIAGLTSCAPDEEPTPPATPGCRAPAGVDASPNTIAEVVTLIDSLPKPTSVACFVESLERPINLTASSSFFSAQPAVQGSPRIFGFYETLIMSWVPAGDGSEVLEFAEERPNDQSVKAELHMPIEGPISYADFQHINDANGTVCGGCHQGEQPAEDLGLGGAFYASEALRVDTADTVSLQNLRDLHDYCDPAFDQKRCEIFAATFDHGELVEAPFPRPLPTIYD